jgi:hypothetical protein
MLLDEKIYAKWKYTKKKVEEMLPCLCPTEDIHD